MKSKLSRILKFIKTHSTKHPIYVAIYAFLYPQKNYRSKALFYSKSEIQEEIKKGRSIIRYGDGEINLFLSIDNHYQKFSKKLSSNLKRIIKEYSVDSLYILAVPKYITQSNKELQKTERKEIWMPFKVFYLLIFPKKPKYLDAHSFYYDGYFEEVIEPAIKDKELIILTNKGSIDSIKNNNKFLWKNISYIECPEKDAYDRMNEIEESLKNILKSKKNPVIIIALGPVGKCIAHTYSNKGYQCIDIGRGLECIYTANSIQGFI
ncbi:MAG: hypothetical protein COU06_00420 [Candidatus Harrisonbacteria bacterium CG10_big_fil_rev_8_21_14_0_10_38_8]|uniref:Glycosyltransferase GT-D fold domain-containing protein n=1 Tax=Candidatus Harrisonbacteria bacterium CG10_big_fil_rev_8_21_14_0_10_38_8 TaxID=1974582 RepID=A0A2M6WKJ9_9BACT|nr:MAG: hypothetical protein COU06_00420 [Candidatus Harrisonbacteria bacterium CG10_big_fil_rev_8_21_14_0_10_38_8]